MDDLSLKVSLIRKLHGTMINVVGLFFDILSMGVWSYSNLTLIEDVWFAHAKLNVTIKENEACLRYKQNII